MPVCRIEFWRGTNSNPRFPFKVNQATKGCPFSPRATGHLSNLASLSKLPCSEPSLDAGSWTLLVYRSFQPGGRDSFLSLIRRADYPMSAYPFDYFHVRGSHARKWAWCLLPQAAWAGTSSFRGAYWIQKEHWMLNVETGWRSRDGSLPPYIYPSVDKNMQGRAFFQMFEEAKLKDHQLRTHMGLCQMADIKKGSVSFWLSSKKDTSRRCAIQCTVEQVQHLWIRQLASCSTSTKIPLNMGKDTNIHICCPQQSHGFLSAHHDFGSFGATTPFQSCLFGPESNFSTCGIPSQSRWLNCYLRILGVICPVRSRAHNILYLHDQIQYDSHLCLAGTSLELPGALTGGVCRLSGYVGCDELWGNFVWK